MDMGGNGGKQTAQVKHIERVLASLTDVVTRTLKDKEEVTIKNLCSFRPYTGKARVTITAYGRKVTPARKRVKVRWSKNFMDNISGGEK